MAAPPAPAAALRQALRLHRLAAADWGVWIAACAPALVILTAATAPVGGRLPAGDLADGDGALILLETVRPVARWLLAAAACGGLVLGAWSALLRAVIVGWGFGGAGDRVRRRAVLAVGVVRWWRFVRLALGSWLAAVLLLGAVGLPLGRLLRGDTAIAGPLLAAGVLVGLLILATCQAARLHGAWLLGGAGRRSAAAAWLHGLGRSLRRPWSSLSPLLLWGLPGVALPLAALLVDSWAAAVLLPAALLAASYCRLALVLSYAPQKTGSSEEAGGRN